MIAVLKLLQIFQENLPFLILHQYLQHVLNQRSKDALVCQIFIDGLIHKLLYWFFCF